ncbi:MAG: hypothetical protein ACTHJS_17835, partial [Xanthobacteraceae bacterium]
MVAVPLAIARERIAFKFGHRHAVHCGRISQAALCELDNLFSDQRCERIGALRQSKGVTGFRKCRAHRVDQFRVERLSLQKRRDGHGLDKLLADMMTPRPA